MKMKALIIALAALSATTAFAEPVVKDFTATGSVIAKPCQPQLAQDFTIPTADAKLIRRNVVEPKTEQSTMIVLTLNNCTVGSVNASILGTAADFSDKSLKIDSTAEGSAQNVAVGFWTTDVYKGSSTLLPVNSGVSNTIQTTETGSQTLAFLAALVIDNPNLPVIGGVVNASAQLRINYL